MGGFTSVPVIAAGRLLAIPCFIHEQNVQPGLANKFLSKITRRVFVSFEETKKYLPGGAASTPAIPCGATSKDQGP
jgi:UDP-N-acetylglucosamine--N-acetylmuramyl-(pentapeptide) pyrophosphoryl-undecaprenol N-acetylglucosamine transferase